MKNKKKKHKNSQRKITKDKETEPMLVCYVHEWNKKNIGITTVKTKNFIKHLECFAYLKLFNHRESL